MERSSGSEQSGIVEEAAPVSKVKQCWREYEDFGVACKLQEKEFSHHYDKNRFERRLMHKDIRLTKEEQKAEDDYAAAYHEQLRRDRTANDERIAAELQKRLNEEELVARREREEEDRLLALRMQCLGDEKIPKRVSSRDQAAWSTVNGVTGGGDKVSTVHRADNIARSVTQSGMPSGVTSELMKAINELRRNEPVSLPPGLTVEQGRAIRTAVAEEDRHFAEEIQDKELARYVQGSEKLAQSRCVKPSELMALSKRNSSSRNGYGHGRHGQGSTKVDQKYAVIPKSTKRDFPTGFTAGR